MSEPCDPNFNPYVQRRPVGALFGNDKRGVLPALVQYAPLMRLCVGCGRECLATDKGLVLWHRELGRDDRWYECVGAGLPGGLP